MDNASGRSSENMNESNDNQEKAEPSGNSTECLHSTHSRNPLLGEEFAEYGSPTFQHILHTLQAGCSSIAESTIEYHSTMQELYIARNDNLDTSDEKSGSSVTQEANDVKSGVSGAYGELRQAVSEFVHTFVLYSGLRGIFAMMFIMYSINRSSGRRIFAHLGILRRSMRFRLMCCILTVRSAHKKLSTILASASRKILPDYSTHSETKGHDVHDHQFNLDEAPLGQNLEVQFEVEVHSEPLQSYISQSDGRQVYNLLPDSSQPDDLQSYSSLSHGPHPDSTQLDVDVILPYSPQTLSPQPDSTQPESPQPDSTQSIASQRDESTESHFSQIYSSQADDTQPKGPQPDILQASSETVCQPRMIQFRATQHEASQQDETAREDDLNVSHDEDVEMPVQRSWARRFPLLQAAISGPRSEEPDSSTQALGMGGRTREGAIMRPPIGFENSGMQISNIRNVQQERQPNRFEDNLQDNDLENIRASVIRAVGLLPSTTRGAPSITSRSVSLRYMIALLRMNRRLTGRRNRPMINIHEIRYARELTPQEESLRVANGALRDNSRSDRNRPSGSRPFLARAAWIRRAWARPAVPRGAWVRSNGSRSPLEQPARPPWARADRVNVDWIRAPWARSRRSQQGGRRRDVRRRSAASDVNVGSEARTNAIRLRRLAREDSLRVLGQLESRGQPWQQRISTYRVRWLRETRPPPQFSEPRTMEFEVHTQSLR